MNTYSSVILKAVTNIVESLKTAADDIYAIAVAAYALQMTDNDVKLSVLDNLNAHEKKLINGELQIRLLKNDRESINILNILGNYVWWSKTTTTFNYGRKESKTLNVEITSYALLAMLMAQRHSDCLPILRWLVNQRNSRGGFKGTQDTILGIEALANFAMKFSSKETNLKINVEAKGDAQEKYVIDVNQCNALVLQSQKVKFSIFIEKIEARFKIICY